MTEKYIPTFRENVEPGNLCITDADGNEHELQPGGWVEFRCDFPFEVLARGGELLTNLEYLAWMTRVLDRQVIAWNWTDARGRPYPQPGDGALDANADQGERFPGDFATAIRDLFQEERTWLLNNCWQAQNPNP